MKKTILCLLLALCLLLMGAAAMADSDPSNNSFSIDDGSITIKDGTTPGTIMVQYGNDEKKDNIDPKTIIEIVGGGSLPQYNSRLSIETQVPVKIRYRVQFPETGFTYPMSIADNADVTLYLDQDTCDACGTTEQAGITLGSGSKLTIDTAESDGGLRIHCGPSAILGPDSDDTPATVILNSGTVAINPTCSNGISGNVNLVINGGTFIAYGTTINVQNLIVTGGELWAGDNDSTKVTYENLSSYDNINCDAGILPNNSSYAELNVFGDLTLPVDLTISGDKSLTIPDGAGLTIPDGAILTIDNISTLKISGTVTNYGTLNCSVEELMILENGILNNNGKLSVNGGNLHINGNGILNNQGELIANCAIRNNNNNGLKNDGTISGSGQIFPLPKKLTLGKPASLTVDSIEDGTVTLSASANANATAQYSLDKTNWQDEPEFTGGIPDAGQTFYARYKENNFFKASDEASITVFPVRLNANGGTIASGKDVGYYIAGQGATLPTNVTRTGYTFAGWYGNAALTGDKVTKIDAKASGAKEYWANWTAKQYNVKLNTNGGTIVGEGLTGYTYGEGAMLPDDVERTGYTFAGWYGNAALTGSPVTAIGADETDDREFWAGWIAAPVITSPAEDTTVTVYEGEQATMTIAAKNAAAYQWTMSTDGGVSWTECGTDSPTYTTSSTKLENNGYQYMCVVTGLNELDKEEQPPKEEIPPEDAVLSLRSRSRSTDDGLPDNAPATESPIFTLEVIRKDAIPQTGDSSHLTLWLALLGGSAACVAACCRRRRSARNK